MFNNPPPPPANRTAYEDVEKYGGARGATNNVRIWRIWVTCWISKAHAHAPGHTHNRARMHTHTHTHRQICNTDCFSTATMIRECALILRYTYIVCIVNLRFEDFYYDVTPYIIIFLGFAKHDFSETEVGPFDKPRWASVTAQRLRRILKHDVGDTSSFRNVVMETASKMDKARNNTHRQKVKLAPVCVLLTNPTYARRNYNKNRNCSTVNMVCICRLCK
jgi:hypothetical protein